MGIAAPTPPMKSGDECQIMKAGRASPTNLCWSLYFWLLADGDRHRRRLINPNFKGLLQQECKGSSSGTIGVSTHGNGRERMVHYFERGLRLATLAGRHRDEMRGRVRLFRKLQLLPDHVTFRGFAGRIFATNNNNVLTACQA